MRLTSISFEKFYNEERWNVEYFIDVNTKTLSGYEMLEVGQVADLSTKAIDPASFPGEFLNYIGMENIESNTGRLVKFSPKEKGEVKSRSKFFKPNNILYGKLRPYLNKVYLAEGEVIEGICSNEFIVLIPNESVISPRLLRFLLSSSFITDQVERLQSGAALPRINAKDLLALKIPVPPVEDQPSFEEFLAAYQQKHNELLKELHAFEENSKKNLYRALENGEPPELLLI